MARLERRPRHGFGDDGSEASPQLRGRPVTRLIEWSSPRIVVALTALGMVLVLALSLDRLVSVLAALPHRAAGVPSVATTQGVLLLGAQLCALFVGIVVPGGLLAIGLHATARRWLARPEPLTYRLPVRAIAVASGVAGVASIALYLVARALVGG
jgi:hypothetical protein